MLITKVEKEFKLKIDKYQIEIKNKVNYYIYV